jgi:hypothetical protein
MLIVKRIVVWLTERLVEGFLLGVLLAYLAVPTFINSLGGIRASGVVVGVLLFMHGYYLTTAFVAVVWRSAKTWLYPTITAALFALHTHVVFLRGRPDFTREARAMELPFVLAGVCIVFACSFAGSRILRRWVTVRTNTNPYLSATGVTVLVFMLANIAHFLRPVVGDTAFRTFGVPLTFYREGGFVDGWVWRSGEIVWRGLLADLGLAVATAMLLATAINNLSTSRADS